MVLHDATGSVRSVREVRGRRLAAVREVTRHCQALGAEAYACGLRLAEDSVDTVDLVLSLT